MPFLLELRHFVSLVSDFTTIAGLVNGVGLALLLAALTFIWKRLRAANQSARITRVAWLAIIFAAILAAGMLAWKNFIPQPWLPLLQTNLPEITGSSRFIHLDSTRAEEQNAPSAYNTPHDRRIVNASPNSDLLAVIGEPERRRSAYKTTQLLKDNVMPGFQVQRTDGSTALLSLSMVNIDGDTVSPRLLIQRDGAFTPLSASIESTGDWSTGEIIISDADLPHVVVNVLIYFQEDYVSALEEFSKIVKVGRVSLGKRKVKFLLPPWLAPLRVRPAIALPPSARTTVFEDTYGAKGEL